MNKHFKLNSHQLPTALKYFITNNSHINITLKGLGCSTILRRKLKQTLSRRLHRTQYSVVNCTPNNTRGLKPQYNFAHTLFLSYKKHLTGNQLPLIGKSPSLYLNDIKPLRY